MMPRRLLPKTSRGMARLQRRPAAGERGATLLVRQARLSCLAEPSCSFRRFRPNRLAGALLRDTRGFMLAEQLISVIFIGLLCLAVGAGLSAALSAYSNIALQTQADAMLAHAVETVNDELAFATSVDEGSGSSTSSAAFVSSTTRTKVFMLMRANGSGSSAGIVLKGAGGTSGTAESIIVPAANGLAPQLVFDENGYNGDTKTWTYSLRIVRADTNETLAQVTNMNVQRMGQ